MVQWIEDMIFARQILCTVGVILLGALPLLATAAVSAFPNAPPESIVSQKGMSGVETLFLKAGNWFFGIVLALAVIFILVAAFNFLFSGGEEEKIKRAKGYLTYAVVAVAIAILSVGIVRLVRLFLTGGSQQQTPPATEELH